jgi:hypothetical protein
VRRAARVDANQAEIVAALRRVGATVQPLHAVGKGCPDLLVGFRQKNFLFEVKDGRRPPSERKLTTDEARWIGGWRGPVVVVTSAFEAIGFLQGVAP